MTSPKDLFNQLTELAEKYASKDAPNGEFTGYGRSMGTRDGVIRSLINAKKQLSMNLGIPLICKSYSHNRASVYGVGVRPVSLNIDKFGELIREMDRFSRSEENSRSNRYN